jgi:hypothetical protein
MLPSVRFANVMSDVENDRWLLDVYHTLIGLKRRDEHTLTALKSSLGVCRLGQYSVSPKVALAQIEALSKWGAPRDNPYCASDHHRRSDTVLKPWYGVV